MFLLSISPPPSPGATITSGRKAFSGIFDCDPVCWEMAACCPGEYVEAPESDGLLVKTTGGAGGRTSSILAHEVFGGNFTSRLRGRLLPEFVDPNGNDLGIVIFWEPTAYLCTLVSDGRPRIYRFFDLNGFSSSSLAPRTLGSGSSTGSGPFSFGALGDRL